MAGFNFQPPPGPIAPMQNLQQMALQAFRPPPPMSMGGGMGMPQQQQQGFGAAQGAGMLSGALGGFKGWGGGDGLPQSGLGAMTGNAAQGAAGMNLMPGNASYGDLGGTGFQPAYDFLGGAGQFGGNWGGGG